MSLLLKHYSTTKDKQQTKESHYNIIKPIHTYYVLVFLFVVYLSNKLDLLQLQYSLFATFLFLITTLLYVKKQCND